MKEGSLACVARRHPAGRPLLPSSATGLFCSTPPAASHWPQLRPPQASHWGLRIDRERSGRHKTNLTLARTNDQLLYSLNCCQEGLAHEKWSCNPLVPRIALAKVGPGGPAPNKLYSDKQTTATLHVINLLWTKAPFLRHRLC